MLSHNNMSRRTHLRMSVLFCFTVAPLQGFLNFIAYTRPRFLRYMKQKGCCQKKPLLHTMETSGDGNDANESDNRVEADATVVPLGHTEKLTADPRAPKMENENNHAME